MSAIRYYKHQQVALPEHLPMVAGCLPPFGTTNISKWHSSMTRSRPALTTGTAIRYYKHQQVALMPLKIASRAVIRHSVLQTSASGTMVSRSIKKPMCCRHSVLQTSASGTPLMNRAGTCGHPAIRYYKHQQVARTYVRSRRVSLHSAIRYYKHQQVALARVGLVARGVLPPFGTTNISKWHSRRSEHKRRRSRPAIRYYKHQQVAQRPKRMLRHRATRHSVLQTSASGTYLGEPLLSHGFFPPFGTTNISKWHCNESGALTFNYLLTMLRE